MSPSHPPASPTAESNKITPGRAQEFPPDRDRCINNAGTLDNKAAINPPRATAGRRGVRAGSSARGEKPRRPAWKSASLGRRAGARPRIVSRAPTCPNIERPPPNNVKRPSARLSLGQTNRNLRSPVRMRITFDFGSRGWDRARPKNERRLFCPGRAPIRRGRIPPERPDV